MYVQLVERVQDVGRLRSVGALLDWDQEVMMPAGGVGARAECFALLEALAHERLVSDETRRLLEGAEAGRDLESNDGDFAAKTILRETRRSFDRATKLPTELVKEIAHTSSLAKEAWARARAASQFASFAPLLAKLLDLKRQVADRIGYETEPYDALMDEFEPGATAASVEPIFAELRKATVDLLNRVRNARTRPDPTVLERHFPRERQETLSRKMAEAIGFDFTAGRADVSTHPFCTTIGGPGDVRITTRYMDNFLPAALFGTLHECGHALYEQGLPKEHAFTPMADAASLGIHESQSRMWENMVGLSRPFWVHHYPAVQALFAESLGDVSLDQFYGAINTVRPSFIRVEADELTYNLHIILRFELERAMIRGDVGVSDIPAAWNERFTKMFGITPSKDAEGCLQDIHWSMGAFGYFPTYTLGNLYAAQFFEQAGRDIPDLQERIAANDHAPLLHWLRDRIHQHGKRYRPGELVERVTGKPLSIGPFVGYLTRKLEGVYALR